MEIKPESLRIGNLMKEHYTGKIISVIELTEKSITFSDSFIGKWQAEPIEVSEEILLKVGIIYRSFYVVGTGNCNKWQLDDFILLKNIDGDFYCPLSAYNPVLEFVHELQNLYFALTGQELNISVL